MLQGPFAGASFPKPSEVIANPGPILQNLPPRAPEPHSKRHYMDILAQILAILAERHSQSSFQSFPTIFPVIPDLIGNLPSRSGKKFPQVEKCLRNSFPRFSTILSRKQVLQVSQNHADLQRFSTTQRIYRQYKRKRECMVHSRQLMFAILSSVELVQNHHISDI